MSPPTRVATLTLLLLSFGARAAAAPPDPDPDLELARTHFYAGARALADGDAFRAIPELAAAQALRPSPVIELYLGSAYDQTGQPCAAVDHYRAYVMAVPAAGERPALEARMAALAPSCAPPLPLAPAPVVAAPTAEPTPVAVAAPPVVRRHSRAWKAAVALGVIGGVLTVAVVGGLVVAAGGGASTSHHHFDLDLRAQPASSPPALALLRF